MRTPRTLLAVFLVALCTTGQEKITARQAKMDSVYGADVKVTDSKGTVTEVPDAAIDYVHDNIFWAAAARPSHQDVKNSSGAELPPLFMAPDFRFSQIDTICVASAIDLRPDKTEPLNLSGRGPSVFLYGRPWNADTALAETFEGIGYKTVSCNPVSGTLEDLKTPSDEWLRKLEFGQSSWLFILAVEEAGTRYDAHGLIGNMGGDAVVSGYLFEKRAEGVSLVWRDKVVGVPAAYGKLYGQKERVKLLESEYAIADGINHLLVKFETRHKEIGNLSLWEIHAQTFDVTCNVLWTALNDALKDPENYEILQIDSSDMMAIYGVGKFKLVDFAILKSKESTCAMQIIETIHQPLRNPVGDLIKHVQASLSK